jgi:transposase
LTYAANVVRRQGYRFRLKPRVSQESLLRRFLGCSRFLWNAFLAENDYRYEQGDPLPLSYAAFCVRLKSLKERHAFLREVHSQPLQQTLRDLTRAYQKAFDPKLAAEMPTFKKKTNASGIRFPQGFKVERNGLFLPKIGWVAFRVSKRTAKKRKIAGDIKNVTVRLEAGRWYVNVPNGTRRRRASSRECRVGRGDRSRRCAVRCTLRRVVRRGSESSQTLREAACVPAAPPRQEGEVFRQLA